MRSTITKRLQLDYDENIDEWVNTLMKVQELEKKNNYLKPESNLTPSRFFIGIANPDGGCRKEV